MDWKVTSPGGILLHSFIFKQAGGQGAPDATTNGAAVASHQFLVVLKMICELSCPDGETTSGEKEHVDA